MKKTLIAIVCAALFGAVSPARAQDVSVSLRLGDGPVRISGYYASGPQYVIPQTYYCEPDGPFMYCWDRVTYVVERPVVYVYPANPRFVVVRRHYRHDRDEKLWRKHAQQAMKRWRKQHRYRESDVRVVLAWER